MQVWLINCAVLDIPRIFKRQKEIYQHHLHMSSLSVQRDSGKSALQSSAISYNVQAAPPFVSLQTPEEVDNSTNNIPLHSSSFDMPYTDSGAAGRQERSGLSGRSKSTTAITYGGVPEWRREQSKKLEQPSEVFPAASSKKNGAPIGQRAVGAKGVSRVDSAGDRELLGQHVCADEADPADYTAAPAGTSHGRTVLEAQQGSSADKKDSRGQMDTKHCTDAVAVSCQAGDGSIASGFGAHLKLPDAVNGGVRRGNHSENLLSLNAMTACAPVAGADTADTADSQESAAGSIGSGCRLDGPEMKRGAALGTTSMQGLHERSRHRRVLDWTGDGNDARNGAGRRVHDRATGAFAAFVMGGQKRHLELRRKPFFWEVCSTLEALGRPAIEQRGQIITCEGIVPDILVALAGRGHNGHGHRFLCLQLISLEQMIAVAPRGQGCCTPSPWTASNNTRSSAHNSQPWMAGAGRLFCWLPPPRSSATLCYEPDGAMVWYAHIVRDCTAIPVFHILQVCWARWDDVARRAALWGCISRSDQ
jgi:hypothetical protein